MFDIENTANVAASLLDGEQMKAMMKNRRSPVLILENAIGTMPSWPMLTSNDFGETGHQSVSCVAPNFAGNPNCARYIGK